jgi:hypothetical protein
LESEKISKVVEAILDIDFYNYLSKTINTALKGIDKQDNESIDIENKTLYDFCIAFLSDKYPEQVKNQETQHTHTQLPDIEQNNQNKIDRKQFLEKANGLLSEFKKRI